MAEWQDSPILTVNDLSVQFGASTVIENLSFQVFPGVRWLSSANPVQASRSLRKPSCASLT